MMVILKVGRSPGWDLGHHEELRNGSDSKIHIWESHFRVSEKFGICPVSFWESSRRITMGHQ
jgi:hypothetical protein